MNIGKEFGEENKQKFIELPPYKTQNVYNDRSSNIQLLKIIQAFQRGGSGV